MQKESHEKEKLSPGSPPLEDREKTSVNCNEGLSGPVRNVDANSEDTAVSEVFVDLRNIFMIGVSISLHLYDIGSDFYLAWGYWITKEYAKLTWTAIFLFVPSLVNIIISIRMYNQDYEVHEIIYFC